MNEKVNDKKLKMVEEYDITPYTFYIEPIQYGSKTYSKIIEWDTEYISPFKPIDIIKKSCRYFGSSYEGRREGTQQLIGITHKAPIAIDPTNSIFFFPTTSPLRPQCIWISHDQIETFQPSDDSNTNVTFRNNYSIDLPISFRSFDNQLHRTGRLKMKLMQRIEETERIAYYMLAHPNASEALEFPSRYPRAIRRR